MIKPQPHSWPGIFAVFITGVVVAFLVGKVPAALPVLRSELGLTLLEAALLVSLLSLIAALSGVVIGALAEIAGQRSAALAGLAIAIIAGIAGALATTTGLLLVFRCLEGIGFFMASVSLPALIIRLSDDRRRQSAMGLWGAYLPLGAGLVLLAGGVVIGVFGWQGLWLTISAVLALCFLVLLFAVPPGPPTRAGGSHPRTSTREIAASITTTVRTPGAVLLAVTFGCYSGQYLAVTSFVPLILVEKAGWALPAATAAGASVMMVNAIGNIAAGMLLDRGVARGTLVVVAALAMAAGATVVMHDGMPVVTRIAGAVFFSSLGGMIPGAMFAGVRRHAPSPAHVSTVNGLMLQAVAIGQFIGPPAASMLVTAGGGNWLYSLIYLLPMAALTVLAGTQLARIESA